jgi:hypothetical protein
MPLFPNDALQEYLMDQANLPNVPTDELMDEKAEMTERMQDMQPDPPPQETIPTKTKEE